MSVVGWQRAIRSRVASDASHRERAVPTHYEVLGVDSEADVETIRRAYVMVAKATHPDRRQSDDPERSARAEVHIRLANAAWNVLRDPDRRAEYDRSLRPDPGPDLAGGHVASTSDVDVDGGVVAGRSSPPSGVVVPAAHASMWRYAPIVVLLVVLLGILVASAYATSRDSTAPSDTLARQDVPGVGECVLVVFQGGGRVPAPVTCGTQGSYRIVSVVDTPRPCPSGSEQLPLSDQKTTLCLMVSG
jgi:DnaJ-domain-containing protein 1